MVVAGRRTGPSLGRAMALGATTALAAQPARGARKVPVDAGHYHGLEGLEGRAGPRRCPPLLAWCARSATATGVAISSHVPRRSSPGLPWRRVSLGAGISARRLPGVLEAVLNHDDREAHIPSPAPSSFSSN